MNMTLNRAGVGPYGKTGAVRFSRTAPVHVLSTEHYFLSTVRSTAHSIPNCPTPR